MYKVFLIMIIIAIVEVPMSAQLHLNGAKLQIQSGAQLISHVDIKNTNNGIINNDGKLMTSGDLINDNSSTLSSSTLDNNTPHYEIQGDWINEGTASLGNALLEFSGEDNSVLQTNGEEIYQLFINKTVADVTLNANLFITQKLDFGTNGANLFLGEFNSSFDELASITNGNQSNHLITNGEGRITLNKNIAGTAVSYFLPISFDEDTYNPLNISLDNSETLQIRVLNNATVEGVNLTASVETAWEITGNNGSALDIDFHWAASDEPGTFNRNNFNIFQNDNSTWSSIYTNLAAEGTNPFSVFQNDINQRGIFALANADALPIVLLFFDGNLQEKYDGFLFWETSEEKDIAYFELERSTNSKNWKQISTINVKNQPHENNHYQYLDKGVFNKTPLSSIQYYRLKMVGNKGEVQYSNIISIHINEAQSSNLSLFPNPAQSKINLSFPDHIEVQPYYLLEIFDTRGQLMLRKKTTGDILDISGLPQGFYLLKTKIKNQFHQTAFVKI